MKGKIQTWIWLAVLVLLVVVISVFSYTNKPKQYPAYVSESPSPSGVKALYTYLTKEMNASRWEASPLLLRDHNDKKLLVIVEPSFTPNREEMNGYKDFMKAGNSILLLADNPQDMFGMKVKHIPSDEKAKIYDQHHHAYKADNLSPVRLKDKTQDEVILSDKYGPIALKRPVGNGQLIVSVTPDWVTNDAILKKAQLTLAINLINEGNARTVVFDEYLHGGQGILGGLVVYPKWFLLIMLQGVLLVLLWLWLRGKRFGAIFTPREETVRFSDEGIRALSAWYMRGKQFRESLSIQADYVKLLLQEKWHIPYNKDWNELTGYLERRQLKMPASELGSLLNGITTVITKEKVSKQEYLLWSKKLDHLRKEVEEG
jgi:hypothetical protein